MFELAYLRLSPRSSRQALTGVLAGSGSSRSRCSGHAASTPICLTAERERRAHPIELTAVSAIVLDLLSGFQRPSRRSPNLHRSGGGPTPLRWTSEAVKHPLWAGTPVVSRT